MSMIAIKIQPHIADLLSSIQVPGKLELKENYHITLFYFEEEPNINKVADLIIPLHNILDTQKIISAGLQEVNHFQIGEDGYPIIIPVISNELLKLREKIASSFDEEGIKFSKKHPEFKPHITLSYSTEPIQFDFNRFTIELDNVCFYGGDKYEDQMLISFPLVK